MAKAKKAKKRADKYDPKLKIDGSFEDVIRVLVNPLNTAAGSKNKKKNK